MNRAEQIARRAADLYCAEHRKEFQDEAWEQVEAEYRRKRKPIPTPANGEAYPDDVCAASEKAFRKIDAAEWVDKFHEAYADAS